MTTTRRYLATVGSILWIGLIVGSILLTERRDAAPGDPGTPATDWPVASTLRPLQGGWTLVMQAHAKCPCTVASLDELERLLPELDGVRTYVLVVCPEGAGAGFAEGPALERARELQGAGVVVVVDVDGVEAARFGARTSGQVTVFDRTGRLCFAGGLTPSRGLRGDGPGRDAILSLIHGQGAAPDVAPVFGCPLQQEGS